MADPDKPEDDLTSAWKAPKRQLRTDGRLTGDVPLPITVVPAAEPLSEPDPSGLPTLAALTTSELELDTSGARQKYVEPGPYRDTVRPSRAAPIKWMLMLGVLGAGAIALFVYFPSLTGKLSLPSSTKGALVIYSEPSGATVKIAGKVVGETPWAVDNLYGGEVKYEISAAGYKPSWGTFQGGANVKLNVKLTRK